MAIWKLECGSFTLLPDDGSATTEGALARIEAQLGDVARDEARLENRRGKAVDLLREQLDNLAVKADDRAISDHEIESGSASIGGQLAAITTDSASSAKVPLAARTRLERERDALQRTGLLHSCPNCGGLYKVTPATEADTTRPGAGCTRGPDAGGKGGK